MTVSVFETYLVDKPQTPPKSQQREPRSLPPVTNINVPILCTSLHKTVQLFSFYQHIAHIFISSSICFVVVFCCFAPKQPLYVKIYSAMNLILILKGLKILICKVTCAVR